MEGIDPRVVVLIAGTNGVANQVPPDGVESRRGGSAAGIADARGRWCEPAPRATLILLEITAA